MSSVLAVAGTRIEFSTVTLTENFEVGVESDFERYLERAEAARREIGQEASREAGRVTEELERARRELEKDLESRREKLDKEFERARGEKATEETEEDDQGFGADRVSRRVAKRAVVIAGSFLPLGFKSQIQTSLLATGDPESALNGWLLAGGGTSTGLLKTTLERLGSLTGRFKLDQEGLEDLKGILKDSGLDEERLGEIMAELKSGELSLDRVLLAVSKAETALAGDRALAELEGTTEKVDSSLTATTDGLTSLGQFLMSLGLSTETVKAVTSGLTPGETLSSADLGALLSGAGGEDLLAPCLVDGDLASLLDALKSMGLDQRGIEGLDTLLGQKGANLGDLLGLLAFLETPEPMSADPAKAAADVQRLLTRTSQEGSLIKAPLFNEIILKLSSLGDRELSDDFAELSPALQALRGGLGQTAQADPLGGHGGGQTGGGHDRREREERHLAAMGLGGETAASRASGDGLFQSTLAGQSAGSATGESLARQLEQKLIYSSRRGVHRLKMNLSPENLGRLDIELKVKDDKLVALITAETEEAYAALEGEMGALKEALAAEGLELVMTLSWDGGGDSRGNLASASAAGTGEAGAAGAGDGEEPAAESGSPEADQDDYRVLDLLV